VGLDSITGEAPATEIPLNKVNYTTSFLTSVSFSFSDEGAVLPNTAPADASIPILSQEIVVP
jgi:hypothetical protein